MFSFEFVSLEHGNELPVLQDRRPALGECRKGYFNEPCSSLTQAGRLYFSVFSLAI